MSGGQKHDCECNKLLPADKETNVQLLLQVVIMKKVFFWLFLLCCFFEQRKRKQRGEGFTFQSNGCFVFLLSFDSCASLCLSAPSPSSLLLHLLPSVMWVIRGLVIVSGLVLFAAMHFGLPLNSVDKRLITQATA